MRRLLVTLLAIALATACSPGPSTESAKKSDRSGRESVTQTTTAGETSHSEGSQSKESSGSPSSSSKSDTAGAGEEARHFRLKGPTPHGQYDYRDVWDSGETRNGSLLVDEPHSSSGGQRQLHSRQYRGMEFNDGHTLIWSSDGTNLRTSFGPGPLLCSYNSRSLLFMPATVEVGEKWKSHDTCASDQGSLSWTFAFERFDEVQVEGTSIPAAVIHANSRHSEGAQVERTFWIHTGGKGLQILKSRVVFRDEKGSSSTVDSLLISMTPKPIEE